VGNYKQLVGASVLVFCAVVAAAQFDGERRRGDLTPLVMPGGSTVEFESFDSKAIAASEPYSVFLPPSYAKEGDRTFPVVYFLHGLNNDQTSWTVERYGQLHNKLEELMLAGKVPEFLMVHPSGGNSFYCNYLDGSRMYEDLVVRELVEYTETRYRARKGRENRAIGGTSMGGYGALKIAMKHPELYASSAGHSPIIFLGKNPLDVPEEMKAGRYYQFFSNIMLPILGDPVRQEVWDANNPLQIARSGKLDGLNIYFDYGTEDRYIRSIGLDRGVRELDKVLSQGGVHHVFREHPGEPHGWALVAAHFEESMAFLSQTFR